VDDAKHKFQAVSLTYQILSDENRRREYDQTGEILDEGDEEFASGEQFDQWEQFFKSLFGKITVTDIDKFSGEYKNSMEERKDVLRYYKTHKGDLNKMLTCVMLSDSSDKQRWVDDYIKPAIQNGEVPRYDAMAETLGQSDEDDEDDVDEDDDMDDEATVTDDEEEDDVPEVKINKKSNKRSQSKQKPTKKKSTNTKHNKPKKMSKKEREAKEAEELMAKIRGKQHGGGALAKRREEAFDSLISGLESRYSGKKEKSKRSVSPPDIPDDEFERIQARMTANRKSRKNS